MNFLNLLFLKSKLLFAVVLIHSEGAIMFIFLGKNFIFKNKIIYIEKIFL